MAIGCECKWNCFHVLYVFLRFYMCVDLLMDRWLVFYFCTLFVWVCVCMCTACVHACVDILMYELDFSMKREWNTLRQSDTKSDKHIGYLFLPHHFVSHSFMFGAECVSITIQDYYLDSLKSRKRFNYYNQK